ncbi:glycine-rich protein 5 [Spinacia oleracea]|uniref:Glycine-rich protein 5 n=1 Tax=Spinacia oleracea TaxID=3562 RepID=A0A9R0IN77_SPIOL|nr:glycine-rich protein 5-like [Spinacia oleracea]
MCGLCMMIDERRGMDDSLRVKPVSILDSFRSSGGGGGLISFSGESPTGGGRLGKGGGSGAVFGAGGGGGGLGAVFGTGGGGGGLGAVFGAGGGGSIMGEGGEENYALVENLAVVQRQYLVV